MLSSDQTVETADVEISPKFPIRNTRVVSRFPEVLRICRGKKVLHLGCADMPYTMHRGNDLLHKQLSRVTGPDMLWGLDYSAEGVRLLREMGFENVIQGDVEHLDQELKEMNFDGRKHYGVIAQEIEKILPELVDTDEEGFKSVDYTSMIGLLVKGLQEKDERIQRLEKELSDLKDFVRSELSALRLELVDS